MFPRWSVALAFAFGYTSFLSSYIREFSLFMRWREWGDSGGGL